MAFNTHNVVQPHLCRVSRHFHHPERKPSTQINAHSPLPTHLLFVFIYLLCTFCIIPSCPFPAIWCSWSRPLPLNVFFMRLPGSPRFPVFLTLISEHWRSRAQSYTSPCLCPHLVPDWLIMVLSSVRVLMTPSFSLQPGLSPDSHLLLSTWHRSTWPVILVRIKSEPLTSPPSLLFLIYVKSSFEVLQQKTLQPSSLTLPFPPLKSVYYLFM